MNSMIEKHKKNPLLPINSVDLTEKI